MARHPQPDRGGAAPAGHRSQFRHHQRAHVLRDERGRPGTRQSRIDAGHAQLRIDSRSHPHTGHAVARIGPRHRRAAEEHYLPVRVGLSVPESYASHAGRVRKAGVGNLARRSEPAGHRGFRLAVQRPRPPDCSSDDGCRVRQLPQCARGKSQARLEGGRRTGNAGGQHHAALRRQPVLVQISVDLFRPDSGDGDRHSSFCNGARRWSSAA